MVVVDTGTLELKTVQRASALDWTNPQFLSTCSFAHSSTGLGENWWYFFSDCDWLLPLLLPLAASSGCWVRVPVLWNDRRYSGGMIPASDGSEMREPTIRMAKLIKLMIESCDYIVNRFFLNLKTNTFTQFKKTSSKKTKSFGHGAKNQSMG